ncbi:MAG: TetR/AcrR family transcriptional regulator [Candidatus Stygibacter australis]|nr:TetR/AcrR family transcriptional regulator [Candidatus Stygibacter australis]
MEIKKRKEWEKRSKQNRIIDLAEELFNENGYEATTLDIIANNVGYSKRNLYQYFTDKNDLFNAVILKEVNKLNKELTSICVKDITGLQKVVAISNTFFTFFIHHRKSFNNIIFFDITYEENKPKNDSEESQSSFGIEAESIHQENLDLLLKAIELGKKDGSIISKFTPKQLQLIIWGQNMGIIHSISRRYDHLESEYCCTPQQVFANYLKMINNCLQCDISSSPEVILHT